LRKIIFIHNNYEPDHFPKFPDLDDRFYTYGFGSNLARNFKKYFPAYDVEMWRLDFYIDCYYEKNVHDVLFRIFPSHRVNKLGEFSFRFIKELKKEVRKNNPILFVSHIHNWLLYQVLFFFKNSDIVTSHHGEWSPYFKFKHRTGFRKVRDCLDILTEKLLMKRVHTFMICDKNQIPYLQKTAPESEFVLFSTGLDTDKIHPVEKSKARKELGWDDSKKYILYVGKLYRYKQPMELIRIWENIRQRIPELQLVIIGNSPEDEYFGETVKSGAMVLGRILNSELNKYYSAADVYVLISLREDYFGGTGIAPLESLACNTPTVSNSLRNYMGDNISEIGEVPCTLEEYESAIESALLNPDKYKNMRKSVEKFYSYKAVAENIEKVISNIISKNRKTHVSN
jgi:glycosyltransferase involved in cell wall biosynthesis